MLMRSSVSDAHPGAGDSDDSISCVKDVKDVDGGEASNVWEGFSDLSDGENKSKSENENDSDSDSEWGGFDDLPERSKSEHILILDKILQDISRPPTPIQLFRGVIRYDIFVVNSGGADAVRDHVLGSLDSDLLNLIETGELCLETLKELKTKKPSISNKHGIYIHIIYNHVNPDVVGIYVGSAVRLAVRIKRHKTEQKKIKRRQKRRGRKRKTKLPSQTAHQKFWAREGYRDFWLCFAELEPPQDAKEKDDIDVILNILEKYSALLFRSMHPQLLRRALPHGVKVDPYRWVGLNAQDPLQQFRPSLCGSSPTFGTSTTSKGERKVMKFYHCLKPHQLLNIVFRYADPSKGDRAQVPLRCSKCSSLSYVIDRTPRYEISTRVYLPYIRMPCYNCSPELVVLFVPVDTTMPFKKFSVVVDAYNCAYYRQIAKDMDFASRTDLEATNVSLLEAWIRSHGFECPYPSRKADVVERADDIRRWLKDPKLSNRPPKALCIKPEAIQSREDLSRLSLANLLIFIRSRGYSVNEHGKNKIEIQYLAREAWDKTTIVRSGTITPKEVRTRADLDGLTGKNLRIWIRSQGWARALIGMNRAGRLDLARRIWDNPDITHSYPIVPDEVRSRKDLERLSKNGLKSWILSRDHEVTKHSSSSKEELLDQARAVSDYLEGFSDDRGARLKGTIATQEKLNFVAKKIKTYKTPKARSDLVNMKRDELLDWIRSQAIVIPVNQTKNKHLALELAKTTWDAVKDGKPLPENVRIRTSSRTRLDLIPTSPRTRSDLSLMRLEDLDLWIRSHSIPIGRGVNNIKKELQSLAEQIWDAIQNGTLTSLRKKLRPDKVKVPQNREDLGQMIRADLVQWTRSQGVSVGVGDLAKERVMALAERTWDAIESGTLDDLKKGYNLKKGKPKKVEALLLKSQVE